MNQVGRERSRLIPDFQTTKLVTPPGKVKALIWQTLLSRVAPHGARGLILEGQAGVDWHFNAELWKFDGFSSITFGTLGFPVSIEMTKQRMVVFGLN
jgi:hypothetical protein